MQIVPRATERSDGLGKFPQESQIDGLSKIDAPSKIGRMATPTRKQREFQQREAMILDVARELLLERGYLALNMDQVATRTEYSKGTIYQHFTCKEDLLMELATQTVNKRADMFSRAAQFRGRTRERMTVIALAEELFIKLYPHYFRVEQVFHTASIRAKAPERRQNALRTNELRCMSTAAGIIRDGLAQGDLILPASHTPEQVTFGLWSLNFGAYTIMSTDSELLELGIDDPIGTLAWGCHMMMDGLGWQPLSTEWDYEATLERAKDEVFPDECREVMTTAVTA